MKSTRKILMGAWTVFALASMAGAAVPSSRTAVTPGVINYQGRLLTPSGGVYSNGVYNIEFRIYDSDSGTTPLLWGCAYPVYVKDGYFNAMLGGSGGVAVTPAPTYGPTELWRALWYDPGNASKANDRYLGLTVTLGPDSRLPYPPVEAFPRQRFLSAPFAERAQMAQYARAAYDTFTVGSSLVVTGLVTAVGGVTAQNNSTFQNVTVNGTMTLNAGMTVNNQQAVLNRGLTVNGATTFVRSGLDVIGVTAFRGGVNAVNSKVQEGSNDLIPRGVIVMWHGSTAPAGWALCDGANGTPDLRGRFVLASGTGSGLTARSWTATGGEENHVLITGELPAHTHDFTVGTVGYVAAYNGSAEATRSPGNSRNNGTRTQGTGSAGSGTGHNNMPPFYVLAYIMKL